MRACPAPIVNGASSRGTASAPPSSTVATMSRIFGASTASRLIGRADRRVECLRIEPGDLRVFQRDHARAVERSDQRCRAEPTALELGLQPDPARNDRLAFTRQQRAPRRRRQARTCRAHRARRRRAAARVVRSRGRPRACPRPRRSRPRRAEPQRAAHLARDQRRRQRGARGREVHAAGKVAEQRSRRTARLLHTARRRAPARGMPAAIASSAITSTASVSICPSMRSKPGQA